MRHIVYLAAAFAVADLIAKIEKNINGDTTLDTAGHNGNIKHRS